MFASARPYALSSGSPRRSSATRARSWPTPRTASGCFTGRWTCRLAHEVIEAVDAAGFHMNVYVDDRLYVEELNEEAITYATHARLEAHAVGDLVAWLDRPTTKIVVVGEPVALDRPGRAAARASTAVRSSPSRSRSFSNSRCPA